MAFGQPMKQLFVNETVLVTGASRGLGLKIAKHFAAQSAHVALVARDSHALDAAVLETRLSCPAEGQQIRSYAVDLADEAGLQRLIADVLRDFGSVKVLVNNAAVQGPIGRFEQNHWQSWRAVFDVNLFAPARLSQLLIPSMRSRGGGKIINLSGGGAASSRPDFSAYAASKCALVRLTETLAQELRPHRIDVNAVAPGAMNTRMLDELIAAGPDAAPREYEAALARSKGGGESTDRAVSLVAWLASSASDGITGKLISAAWDDWEHLENRREELLAGDLFTLRRVT
jgi:3-oxoacyl-[acyl-carrier protein] reductase